MKKSEEIRRKTWRMIAKNLIVLVALAVAAVVGVMSWFSQNKNATADGISIECQTPEGLEIAIMDPQESSTPDDSDWVDGTVVLSSTNKKYSFLSTLAIAEITGDGITFIKPPIIQNSSAAIVDASQDTEWNSSIIHTTPNVEYISFNLYMRVKTANQKVVFSTNSYFGPENRNENFGNSVSGWSPNSVIGAARLAVIDPNNGNTRRLLWLPAPHLYFDGESLQTNVTDPSNTLGLNTLNEYGVVVPLNNWGTFNHAYYKTDKTTEKVLYSDNPVDAGTKVTAGTNFDFKLPYEVTIATFDSQPANDGYYYSNVRVNIWIEGEDTESRALQVGGEFVASLNLALRNNS